MTSPTDQAQQLKQQLQNCNGFDGDTISKGREEALNYYFQRPRGDEVAGRSDVVSGDVSAMVDATVAQMLDAFSSERICDFDPMDLGDESQAQLESEAVQYFVMGRENGLLELVSAIKEALLCRNGVIQIDAKERKTRRVKNFRNVELEAYAELRDDPAVVDESYNEKTGDLSLTYERRTLDFDMESVSLENFLYHSEWNKPILDGIPVCAVRHIGSKAELVELGMPKKRVMDLTPHRADLKSEGQARNPRHNQKPNKPIDASQERVEWYDVFLWRESGDVQELRRIKFSYQDGVILKDEPAPFINLAAGVAILNPHRFAGISLYDKLKQNQDIRTQLRRALLDNVNATTKHRLAGFEDVVNEDDTADARVNNMVRIRQTVPDVRAALMPLAVPDTSANILQNLESTARERSEMGGAALDMQSAQMQVGGDRMGSQGLEKAYSVAEQLTASMMKVLAMTLIRSVFLLAHATLREYFDEEVPIKRNGKWTYVKPSEWPERHSVTIKPGMSPGERQRRIAAMDTTIDLQLTLAREGMDEVLVDIHGFNAAVMERARLAEVQSPERFFIDPDSDQSKVALQNKAKQREQEKMNKAALMQNALGLEQLQQALQKYIHESDLQFKYFDSVLNAEVEEAKIVGSATADLAKMQGAGNDEADREDGPRGEAADGERAADADDSQTED